MSTLHLYHWENTVGLKHRIKLMNQEDSLVIYGHVTEAELNAIQGIFTRIGINWYLVNNPNEPHINDNCINHDDWLKLIISNQNCFAWK
ncbi:hypothetical protein [Marinicella litoralis]|uniref:Uncharacterized protein n=1 Tax=Marinicella litoralis TaxID=644220 RepID=A0A4R6XS77_9GAMM|nr:hypothetical protein [Marinicella litoralis]TDR22782.1 hypothetical protein C8D91_1275 [Marinicella litoralis]